MILHPHLRHQWAVDLCRVLAKDKERFERDTELQFKIHKTASYFWIVNFVLALIVFFAFPGLWAHASVLYLVLVSLWANFATDYGAVSSALAAQGNTPKE
jgi:hypothetical protein